MYLLTLLSAEHLQEHISCITYHSDMPIRLFNMSFSVVYQESQALYPNSIVMFVLYMLKYAPKLLNMDPLSTSSLAQKWQALHCKRLFGCVQSVDLKFFNENKEITNSFNILQAERSKLIEQRKSVSAENQEFWAVIGEKRKEMEPLQDALGKLRGPRKAGREGGSSLCSSEEELDDLVSSNLFVLLVS